MLCFLCVCVNNVIKSCPWRSKPLHNVTGRMPEEWPEFPSSVALLDKNISFVLNYSRERCDLWEQNDFYSYAWINWASSSSLVVLIHPLHFLLTVWHEQSFIVWLCSIDTFIRLRRVWGEYCAQLFDLQENTCFHMKTKSERSLRVFLMGKIS